ncbi:IS4 family transposase [Vallitalea sediminicola]
MNEYADFVKKNLVSLLDEMGATPWLFVKMPAADFTRKRKLDFKEMLRIILSMGGNSLNLELMKYFSYNSDVATCSAFVQQRSKILPEAFEFIFHEFTSSLINPSLFHGYRLLAVDGSDFCTAQNPNELENHFSNTSNAKGYNLLHLNAMYDVCNRIYVDSIMQQGRKEDEYKALIDMVDRSKIKEKAIVTADRGYESYNVLEHIAKKGWNYVVRVKDINSNGIVSGLTLPKQRSFDIDYEFLLTRRQTNFIKSHPKTYKFMPTNQKFDYLPIGSKETYPMSFRIVRFPLTEDTYEVILTNLDRVDFPPEIIKGIYHMRWGIETSFRELKYAIGLINFHSKKAEYIIQEIFAKLTMYNFCEVIATHVIIHQKDRKYTYQLNFTVAINVCLYYFTCRDDIPPPNVEALIQKNILPVRPGRKDPRKVKTKSTVSFLYRVA